MNVNKFPLNQAFAKVSDTYLAISVMPPRVLNVTTQQHCARRIVRFRRVPSEIVAYIHTSIPVLVLRRSRQLYVSRVSPATDRLPARLFRRGAPLPRLRRQALQIHSLGAPLGLDVRIYDGVCSKSCPVSDLARCVTRARHRRSLFCLDYFGRVLSDFRSPETVGHSAGGTAPRARASWRQVKICSWYLKIRHPQ